MSITHVFVAVFVLIVNQRPVENHSASGTPAQETARKMQKSKVEPVTAVADFLAEVRKATVTSIENSYDKEWVRGSNIAYVLTIPAIWNDMAKVLMVQAATSAGYGVHNIDFHFVSEPEAAAAYCLHSQPSILGQGDGFVICDAGGGTVDLVSYRITESNPLKLVECVSGTGISQSSATRVF